MITSYLLDGEPEAPTVPEEEAPTTEEVAKPEEEATPAETTAV